ncbi:MAG: hypothetical protein AB7T63_04400 [Planctomycetota bacterium]
MRVLALALLFAGGWVAGCGDPGPASPGAVSPQPPEVVVRGRIEALFQAVRQDDVKAVLPFVARRGDGEERRFVALTGTEREMQELPRIRSQIAKHVAAGTAHFDRFETQEKRGQSWLAWHLVFGEGEGAVKALYAFVDIDGTWLLGDID